MINYFRTSAVIKASIQKFLYSTWKVFRHNKMATSYGATDNSNARRLSQPFVVDGLSDEYDVHDVAVRMAVPSHPMWRFADEGETIELYVTFAEGVVGMPYTNGSSVNQGEDMYEVEIAGEHVPLVPLMCFPTSHSTMFKATTVVKSSRFVQAGEPVPFSLQYKKKGTVVDEEIVMPNDVTEVTRPNMPVYFQPIWKQLLDRDNCMLRQLSVYEGDGAVNANHNEPTTSQSAPLVENMRSSVISKRSFTRPGTPQQLAGDDFFLYYTRKCWTPFFHSNNSCVKFVRELMVTPLTNFTGLSLYFQLYLVEIFHVNFLTKLFHYLTMPMIVLFMATWCAQWRLIGSYRVEDVSIFIANGTMIFLLILQAWYLVWGSLYGMFLFGIFMVWPLFFMYMLANMLFQITVINSLWIHDSDMSVADVKEIWGQKSNHWYDVITLEHFGVVWYLNPLLWAVVFSAIQAFSHGFEDKLPPRVSQTAHWLDLTTILKQNGYVATCWIIVSQGIFGTLNEFFASPRLLPVLLLRMCYNLGYDEKQWVKFRMLVDDCLKYGDPAIDYIGRGGARWPEHFQKMAPDELDSRLGTIERVLTKEQKQTLTNPKLLKDPVHFTMELQHYVLLRHRLTKYKIQVNAYGPFTPKDSSNLTSNDVLLKNDFPDDPAFRTFLEEVRSHFAEMEYTFVNNCQLRPVFL